MSALQQVSEILSQPLGNFVYQLLLLLAVGAALGMAWGHWQRARHEQARRLLIAMSGLALVRIGYIVAALVTRTGWANSEVLLPPLERFADTASLVLLAWALVPPARRGVLTWDLVFGANLAMTVGMCLAFTVLWGRALAGDPALDYNAYWQSIVWSVWQISLVVLTGLAVTRHQEQGRGIILLAMAFLFMGQVLQILTWHETTYPGGIHIPIWERLANLVAYPLIVIAIYQHIVAGLRVHSRQLQDISQASLDQIKSLLYLFEVSQRMSSSLDLSTVLDNAVRGVARALDADQCAIAFPAERDPSQMHLVAIYNPTRRGRGEVATFPLEYQLAVQQAVRRKGYVIVEESENVQMRALFGLLGSSQTGPLLVQPLLADEQTIGAIIVGNGHSGRSFTPNEAKLCQAMAEQMVTAIQNSRRYRLAQDRVAAMTAAQNEARRTSRRAKAHAQELADRLAEAQVEIETLRQRSDALGVDLVSSRSEADTLAGLGDVLAGEQALQDPSPIQTTSRSREAPAEAIVPQTRRANDVQLPGPGASAPPGTTIQVHELVEGVVTASRTQIDDKILTVDLELADDLPAVKAELDHLERILSGLLTNACLASPLGGRIRVRVDPGDHRPGLGRRPRRSRGKVDGFVTISVEDSGGGLSDAALSQIFEPTRSNQRPPGLGESGAALVQIKTVVEAFGGHLWVESEDGVGTTFGFVLPVDQRQPGISVDQSVGERGAVTAG